MEQTTHGSTELAQPTPERSNVENAQAKAKNKIRNIDGGWAWVILAGVTMFTFHIGGIFKIIGVLYVEFLDLFQAGPVVTSLIGAAYSIMFMLGSLFGGYIADRSNFHMRRIFLVCYLVVSALGVGISGYVPNVVGVIFCFGVMTGFCGGSAAATVLTFPGIYFEKRRSLAYGISFTGSTISSLVMPILLTLSVQEFTLRGTMLIFAGVWMHTLFVPASITPVKEYLGNSKLGNKIHVKSDKLPARDKTVIKSDELNANDHIMSKPDMATVDIIQRHQTGSTSDGTISFGKCIICPDTDDAEGKGGTNMENCVSKIQILSDMVPEVKKHSNVLSDEPKTLGIVRCCHFVMSYKNIVTSRGVAPLAFSLLCGFCGYYNQFLILPPLARELHMDKLQGAILVTLPNGPEFISRIIVGILVDICHISKGKILIVSYLLSGILGIMTSFFRDNITYLVYSAVYGAIGGICIPLGIPMLMDLVHPDHYGKATGLFPVLVGLSTSIGPPILTLIAEQTGTFTNSLRMCAGMYLLGAMVYVITQICNARLNKCNKIAHNEQTLNQLNIN